jgi:hypothetical protein
VVDTLPLCWTVSNPKSSTGSFRLTNGRRRLMSGSVLWTLFRYYP